MYIRFPLSLRQVEDLVHERGIDICHETVRFWWNRFGPMLAAEIRKKRSAALRTLPQWRWHLDEVFVKINGEMHNLWRAVDHEGEVLEPAFPKYRPIFSAARRRFCYKNHEVVAYMERRLWHTRWVHRNRGAFGSFLTVD